MPLSRHSVGTYRETAHMQLVRTFSHSCLSSLTLWTDPGRKSRISVLELISTSHRHTKKSEEEEEKRRQEIVEHSPQILASEEKVTTTTHHHHH